MTQLLEKILIEVDKLPLEKQDFIATIILEELEDEQRWDKAFAESQDLLAKLAEEARADIKAGRVKKWKLMSCELISNRRFYCMFSAVV